MDVMKLRLANYLDIATSTSPETSPMTTTIPAFQPRWAVTLDSILEDALEKELARRRQSK
jgi:uncharacterized lipoprotein YmbA